MSTGPATQGLKINANVRAAGKATSRGLRISRQIPAVIYGPKVKPLSISIHENDAVKYAKTGYENSIFTLESGDSTLNGLKVLRKSMDIHPVSRRPVHLDFFAPDMTQKVRVNVEVRIHGKAKGTAEGGLVSMVRRDIEIECLPLEIPSHFDLDVTDLDLNASMHVSDIKIPEGVRLMTDQGETIVTCSEVKEEVAAPVTAAAEAGAAGAAAPAAGAAAAPAAAAKK